MAEQTIRYERQRHAISVRVPAAGHALNGDLVVPTNARRLILFAHGSGSSRLSPRNRFVAATLELHGCATLLMDLLTPEEEAIDAATGHLRFDIGLLAGRLVAAIDWIKARSDVGALPIGLFGASTGAAAALMAAAARPHEVAVVVSRGGRPDLAGEALAEIRVPTLLIVGSLDTVVVGLNRDAMARMPAGAAALEIVPGATHLFEEPGTLERVAEIAWRFFDRYAGLEERSERKRG